MVSNLLIKPILFGDQSQLTPKKRKVLYSAKYKRSKRERRERERREREKEREKERKNFLQGKLARVSSLGINSYQKDTLVCSLAFLAGETRLTKVFN